MVWPRCECGAKATVGGDKPDKCFACMEAQLRHNTSEPGMSIEIPPLEKAVGDGQLDDLDPEDWERLIEERTREA